MVIFKCRTPPPPTISHVIAFGGRLKAMGSENVCLTDNFLTNLYFWICILESSLGEKKDKIARRYSITNQGVDFGQYM